MNPLITKLRVSLNSPYLIPYDNSCDIPAQTLPCFSAVFKARPFCMNSKPDLYIVSLQLNYSIKHSDTTFSATYKYLHFYYKIR